MAQESDVAALIEQPRMVLVVNRVGVGSRAIFRNVMSLTGFADIAVENHLSVHGYRNMVALGPDLFGIPLSQGREFYTFGRDNSVDRTVLLIDT